MEVFSHLSTPAVLAALAAVLILYLWGFTRWHYWKRRGVPFLEPVLPIFGNMYDLLFLRSLADISHRIYEETKDVKYTGIYACHTPVLYVRDLDLIAKILVNDFNHFVDRGFHYNKNDLLGRNIIHQNGSDWKYSRTKLSPCFNINKVKTMVPVMKEKSEELLETIKKDQANNSFVEMYDTSLRYTTDVVTLCTIGVDANSIQNKKDQFREMSTHLLGIYFIYHVFIGCFFPWLHRLLGITVAKKRVTTFFYKVVKEVVEYRKDSASDKKDVMQTLLQLKNESSKAEMNNPGIDLNFIAAQSFIFFLAGFESPGNILACTLYEVGKNHDMQRAITAEIHQVLSRHDGQVTFESLQDMKYMRQVVSETLRLYSPLTLIFRRCTKDYQIPGTSTVVQKGTLVLIPLRSIHEDPQYYPEPRRFDPERFSEENSATRHIAAYMPFGVGPRFCPAVLYSHIKIRMALVNILRRFEVSLAEGTPTDFQACPKSFLLAPKNGIPLTFKPR